MHHSVRTHPRASVVAVSVLAMVCALAAPARADAAPSPRFLLAAAPAGVVVHVSPAGPVTTLLGGRTPLGTPTWLWIVATARDGRWGRAVLPVRPNGATGWIDLRGLRTVRSDVWVAAGLRARRIWLMRGGDRLASYPAAIGATATPTPIGRFSVTDSVLTGDPAGPFGWYAFGLSGHQPNLPPQWAGGDQLAIHGTNDPASIGTPASHGCLRVPAQALIRLRATLRLGTPVVIMPTRRRATLAALRASLPRYAPDLLRRVTDRHPHHRHPPTATVPPALVALPTVDSPQPATPVRAMPAIPPVPVAPPAVLPTRPRDTGHRSSHRRHATPSRAPLPWPLPRAVALLGRSPPRDG